jgi:hypothetical protein
MTTPESFRETWRNSGSESLVIAFWRAYRW